MSIIIQETKFEADLTIQNGLPGKDGADSTVPGPQGEQGIQGEQGPIGPQGPQGDPGVNTWGSLAGTLADQGDLQSALDSKAPSAHAHSTDDITGGVLPLEHGGTGATTVAGARTNLDVPQKGDLANMGTNLAGRVVSSEPLEIVNPDNWQVQLTHTEGSVFAKMRVDASGNFQIAPSSADSSLSFLSGTSSIGFASLGVGNNVTAGNYSFAQGDNVTAGNYSFAQGNNVTAGNYSFAQGNNVTAGYYSFAQGNNVTAGYYSFAQGNNVTAGSLSFAQGNNVTAGYYSFAQGDNVTAGSLSFAQGWLITADSYSFAQGSNVTAGNYSFAQGLNVSAGNYSFAQGLNVSAGGFSFAQGYSVSAGDSEGVWGSSVAGTAWRNVYWGAGKTHATPPIDLQLNATGGLGTDVKGTDIWLSGGRPTGTGKGGSAGFRTSPPGASGATLRPLVNRFFADNQGVCWLNTASANPTVGKAGHVGLFVDSGVLKIILPDDSVKTLSYT